MTLFSRKYAIVEHKMNVFFVHKRLDFTKLTSDKSAA